MLATVGITPSLGLASKRTAASRWRKVSAALTHWLRKVTMALQRIGPRTCALFRLEDLFGYDQDPWTKNKWTHARSLTRHLYASCRRAHRQTSPPHAHRRGGFSCRHGRMPAVLSNQRRVGRSGSPANFGSSSSLALYAISSLSATSKRFSHSSAARPINRGSLPADA